MDNFDFLKTVLGDEGFYCIVGLKKDSDRPVQKFFPTLEQATEVAKNLVNEGYDAYYALATFEDGKSRKTVNVKQLRSLYLDLDCGEGKPYPDQSVALQALEAFCTATNIPAPTTVNSGGGVHAYWPLTAPITREQWTPLAEKLKQLCDENDLQADPAVTADPARILRVPGTLNFKLDIARPVSLISEPTAPITYEQARQIIGEPILARKSYLPRAEMDEMTKALVGNYTSRFQTIMQKTMRSEGCQQLKYVYENQATMPEPMWRAGLSIAKFCVDAEVAIQKISNKHPGYDAEVTARKVHGIKGGPYTCVKFEEYNPGGCSGCPNQGCIKSPIVLGREVLEATAEDNIVEDVPENMLIPSTQTYVIPDYPKPYFRARNGGVYKRFMRDEEEAEVQIYHNDIYVTRRLLDPEAGEAVVVRLHLPKDGIREFTIPLSAVTSKDELRKYLSVNGVALVKSEELQYYITTWVNQMQYTKKADLARRQFGWVDDKMESFVIGDKEIRADRVDVNPPSNATAQLFPAFSTKGTFEDWKEAISFYNRSGMEVHQFTIGLSLGTIFTRMTPIHGAVMHLYSPQSGVGKTTAMMASLGIWGDPSQLMVTEKDTMASKMNRTEIYNNLPIMLDEVTNASARELSEFAYAFTSGHQRNRMSSSSNQERYRGMPWYSMAISSGNTNLIERMAEFKASPLGEAMRVFQIQVHPVLGLSKTETDALSKKLANNYGHAYLPYLQYVMSDLDGVKTLYETTQKKVDTTFNFGPPERFYSVLITNAMMGIMLGRKLGFFDFDMKAIIVWLQDVVQRAKDAILLLEADAETLLVEFMAENYNNILMIKSTDDGRVNNIPNMEHLTLPESRPKFQFVARYETDLRQLFIYPAPLRKWCVERQINYEGMLDSLKNGRAKAVLAKKRMGKGTKDSLPPVTVLCINCEGFMTDEVEAEVAIKAKSKIQFTGDAVGTSGS
jgi:hypothetical protein